jgi:hypothetical protein
MLLREGYKRKEEECFSSSAVYTSSPFSLDARSPLCEERQADQGSSFCHVPARGETVKCFSSRTKLLGPPNDFSLYVHEDRK